MSIWNNYYDGISVYNASLKATPVKKKKKKIQDFKASALDFCF